MHKFQHSAHPVLLIEERCAKRYRHHICSYTASVSTHAIALTRQSFDESSSASLYLEVVISVIEGHWSFKKWIHIMKLFAHQR